MKSFFLFLVILGALLTSQVFGQTKKTTTTTTVAETAPTPEVPKSDFDKFYERLSISYFSVFTTPDFKDWDSNNAAISPEWELGDDCRNCDTYSMNLWNQVNFAYNFGAKMKLNVIPRFTIFFDTPSDQGAEERGNILIEDLLVGFSGVVASSADKKFNWWMRPGMRLPTSHFSRTYNHPDFGRLTYGLEWLQTFTYDFSPAFQVGLVLQDRMWVFDNRYNISRFRHLTSPYVSYALDDKTKVQLYYENIIENNKRYKSINGLEPIFYDVWQNAYIGVSRDITSKLNIFPYISAFVNDVPFSTESFWGGMWISYQIK